MLKTTETQNDESKITPFLKWAGGKRWLVSSHPSLFPIEYERYIEPFLGSGAVYFHMRPKNAILGDSNSDLINAYTEIKLNWKSVFGILKKYHKSHSPELYYRIRAKKFRSATQKAAQFIYLNRTCWNGLYRVNLNGDFNVPIGTKKKVILETDDFEAISNKLQNTKLYVSDFEETINLSKAGDFLFVDPPYTVKHNLNGFVKYNNQLFSWEDQIRLRNSVEAAVKRGVKVLVTNADHDSIRELYKDVGMMISLNRLSIISGDVKARGKYSELIIKCFEE